MPVNGGINEEDVVHICNVILFSHEWEGHPEICKNTDRPWGHYAKGNKSDRETKFCRILLFYEFSKNINLIETN